MKAPKTCIYCLLFFLFFKVEYQAQTETQKLNMLELVNKLRAQNGLSSVFLNQKLNTSAQKHSLDMANNNYFDHKGRNGSSFSERIRATGYSGIPVNENIAAGNQTVIDTFKQWENSTGHLNNILNPDVNEMGIGYGFNANATYRHYWTQVFSFSNNLSVKEPSTSSFVTYPNPVKDVIFVKTPNSSNNLSYALYSCIGKLIKTETITNGSNTFKIDVKSLPIGIYFLKLNKSKVQKVIKH